MRRRRAAASRCRHPVQRLHQQRAPPPVVAGGLDGVPVSPRAARRPAGRPVGTWVMVRRRCPRAEAMTSGGAVSGSRRASRSWVACSLDIRPRRRGTAAQLRSHRRTRRRSRCSRMPGKIVVADDPDAMPLRQLRPDLPQPGLGVDGARWGCRAGEGSLPACAGYGSGRGPLSRAGTPRRWRPGRRSPPAAVTTSACPGQRARPATRPQPTASIQGLGSEEEGGARHQGRSGHCPRSRGVRVLGDAVATSARRAGRPGPVRSGGGGVADRGHWRPQRPRRWWPPGFPGGELMTSAP